MRNVTSRADSGSRTPIRATSAEFAELPRLLTAPGWKSMFFEDIDHFGLPGAPMLCTPDSTEAGAAFARDRWEIYCSNNAFKVNLLIIHVPPRATLMQSGRGQCDKKNWLKRIYVTVSMSEVKVNQSGWVPKRSCWSVRV